MIGYELYCQLRQLHEQKQLTATQIAAELKLHLRTVQKWLARPTYQRRRTGRRPSKLDAFKGQIVALLERHPYSAQQVLQQLRTAGYAGGYSILRTFVQQVRPVRKPAFLPLQFAPGECAQVDWGSFGAITVGNTRRRLSFFVMVLCYSRRLYVEFTLTEGMEQFLHCHRNALEYFGGVPRRIMIDNLKVGVLHHPFGQPAQFHPRYRDLAAHYGFAPVACGVRKAHEKGRVENAVGYVKKNFLAGLELPGFPALNPAVREWLTTIADVRLHGETRRPPVTMFTEEKPQLQPLPVLPYDTAVIRPISVNACCRVTVETNRYSVPHLYASQRLTLKLYPAELLLFHHERLIATHQRSYDRRREILNPDHHKELLQQRLRARQQTQLLTFLALSSHAEAYVRKLEEKRQHTAHHVQKIIALSEIYGADQIDRALQTALTFEAYGCEYIANLLAQGERNGAPPGALHLTHRQDLLDLDLPPADLTTYERCA